MMSSVDARRGNVFLTHPVYNFQFQAIHRYAIEKNYHELMINNIEAAFAIRSIMVLPLMPVVLMEDGFAAVQQRAVNHGLGNVLRNFFRYVQRYWFDTVTPDILSIADRQSRTNNAVESFYSSMNRRFSNVPHPNFWDFIGEYLSISNVGYTGTRYHLPIHE